MHQHNTSHTIRDVSATPHRTWSEIGTQYWFPMQSQIFVRQHNILQCVLWGNTAQLPLHSLTVGGVHAQQHRGDGMGHA